MPNRWVCLKHQPMGPMMPRQEGGPCTGLSDYPNATITDYGSISGADAMPLGGPWKRHILTAQTACLGLIISPATSNSNKTEFATGLVLARSIGITRVQGCLLNAWGIGHIAMRLRLEREMDNATWNKRLLCGGRAAP